MLTDSLDRTSLDYMRGLPGGEPLVGTLIRTFRATSAADLAAVRRGAEEARWSEVGGAVHRLQGSSAILGVLQVAAVCRAIEERVRAARTGELGPLVARLGEELERAWAALDQIAGEVAVD